MDFDSCKPSSRQNSNCPQTRAMSTSEVFVCAAMTFSSFLTTTIVQWNRCESPPARSPPSSENQLLIGLSAMRSNSTTLLAICWSSQRRFHVEWKWKRRVSASLASKLRHTTQRSHFHSNKLRHVNNINSSLTFHEGSFVILSTHTPSLCICYAPFSKFLTTFSRKIR